MPNFHKNIDLTSLSLFGIGIAQLVMKLKLNCTDISYVYVMAVMMHQIKAVETVIEKYAH